MTRETTDHTDTDRSLLEELHRLAPRPPLQELPPGAHDRVRARLLGRATERHPRGSRRRTLLAWAATAAVAAAVLVQVSSSGTGSGDRSGTVARPAVRGVDPQAVAVLTRAATVAARIPGPVVSADQFAWSRSLTRVNTGRLGGPAHLGPAHVRQVWLPEAARVPSAHLGLIRENGSDLPISSAGPPVAAGVRRPTYDWLSALPADPSRLLFRLSAEVTTSPGDDRDQAVFTAIGDLLRDSLVPPRTASALYRAAALIPGVTVTPGAVDLAGRSGIGISRRDDRGTLRAEWVFDRHTRVFLGERQWLLHGRAADLFSTTAVLDRGVADRAGEPPVG